MDDNDRTGLRQVLTPLRAVQSVDTLTSDYDAELERATGGTINVILKSGANQFHSEAYEFNRVSVLAARNFLNTSPASLKALGSRNTAMASAIPGSTIPMQRVDHHQLLLAARRASIR